MVNGLVWPSATDTTVDGDSTEGGVREKEFAVSSAFRLCRLAGAGSFLMSLSNKGTYLA